MSHKTIILRLVIFLLLVLGGFALVFFVLPLLIFRFPLVEVETQRLNSPDGKVDAVLIQRDAGAMTSVRFFVYVVPKDEKPTDKDTVVFRATKAFDMQMTWQEDGSLLIQYPKAYISHFQNYIYPFPEDMKYRIEIREQMIESDHPILY